MTTCAFALGLTFVVQLGHTAERKERDTSEEFVRKEKRNFGLRDLEVMETLGERTKPSLNSAAKLRRRNSVSFE